MASKLKVLSTKIDELTLRERLMVMVAMLVLMFTAWDNFFWQPMNAEQQQLQNQLSQAEGEIKLLNVQIGGVAVRAGIDPNADLKKQLEGLKLSLQQVQKQVQAATADLVAPQQMSQLLESLLRKQGALQLIELRTLGPIALLPSTDESGAEGAGSRVSNPQKNSLNLYQHGFVLEFEGDFFAVLAYLRALEALKSAFYWDTVQYDVITYPRARVRLHLHTLSLSEGWIGV